MIPALFVLVAAGSAQQSESTKIPVKAEPVTQPVDSMKAQAESKPIPKTEPKPVVASGITVEAKICTGIEERQPTGAAEKFPPEVDMLYLWSRIDGCMDTTVVHHKWYHNGMEMANVELPVKSGYWRTWSSKTILPSWTGNWEVKVTDAEGRVLATVPFVIE